MRRVTAPATEPAVNVEGPRTKSRAELPWTERHRREPAREVRYDCPWKAHAQVGDKWWTEARDEQHEGGVDGDQRCQHGHRGPTESCRDHRLRPRISWVAVRATSRRHVRQWPGARLQACRAHESASCEGPSPYAVRRRLRQGGTGPARRLRIWIV